MGTGVIVAASTLLRVHRSWAWVVIIANGLAGCWALAAHRWPEWRTRSLWWFTGAAEVAVFVQVGLGVGMVAGEHKVAAQFHMFYGFVAIIAVSILDKYLTALKAKVYLLYGGGGLFVMGLAIRALLKAKVV